MRPNNGRQQGWMVGPVGKTRKNISRWEIYIPLSFCLADRWMMYHLGPKTPKKWKQNISKDSNANQQVHSDNDASEVGILGHIGT